MGTLATDTADTYSEGWSKSVHRTLIEAVAATSRAPWGTVALTRAVHPPLPTHGKVLVSS